MWGSQMVEGLTGSLAQLSLADILKMLAAGSQTGRIELSSGLDRGELYLENGNVVHADASGVFGERAFTRLLSWPNGAFRFEAHIPAPETTIDKPLDRLFAESARHASEREAIRKVIPSMSAVPKLAKQSPAPTVTIEAHEWQIIALVDGQASITEIADVLGREEFEILKQLYRLKTTGLIELTFAQPVAAPQRVAAGAQFFAFLTTAVAAAMGPLAEIVIDDALDALGLTRATMPRDAIAALAERISADIRDENKRVRFQQTMLAAIRNQAAA
jgi:hypothetical protein